MISQGDIQGRLRLFRYGLIVLVIVTFLVSILAPFAVAAPYATEINTLGAALAAANGGPYTPVTINISDFIGNAILYTLVVAVIAVIIYFVYSQVISRPATK